MTVLIAPAAMRDFLGGPPVLLLLDGVADASPLALPGLALWRARSVAGGWLLLREDGAGASGPVAAPDSARAAAIAEGSALGPAMPPSAPAGTGLLAPALPPRPGTALAAEPVVSPSPQASLAGPVSAPAPAMVAQAASNPLPPPAVAAGAAMPLPGAATGAASNAAPLPGTGAVSVAPVAPVPLLAAPAGLLAVVAPDVAAAAPLLAEWAALAPAPPPLIEAPDGAAALPGVARLALAAWQAQAAQAAQLHRSLAATRVDYEEARIAVLALQQSVGHLPPPAPTLRVAGEPAPEGLLASAVAGRLLLGQPLGVVAAGVCAVALHLARAEAGPGSWLGVRLYGGESGRVLGAWRLPGEALAPGWLTLDLPAPVGPVRETACLDIMAELAPGDALALALEDRPAAEGNALVLREGEAKAPGRSLALRLWTAPLGRRYAQARHWDPEQLDLPLAPEGMPVAMPAQVWEAAEQSAGGHAVAFGSGQPRPMALLGGGEQVLLRLPLVPVNGLDVLEAELALRQGDAGGLEAGLWLQPVGDAPLAEAAMRLDAPGARWSGWRRFDAAAGRLGISLGLRPGSPAMLAAVLVLRNTAPAVSEPARVEWAELLGRRLCQLALVPPPATPRRAAPVAPRTELRGVRLQELWRTEDGGYQHLDLWLDGMRAGGLAWPLLRCKFAINGQVPQLEFRARADWPQVFDLWPGDKADEHGPVFVLPEHRVADALAALANGRDRRMLEALLRALPAIIGTVAHQASSDPKDHENWIGMARRLSAMVEPAVTLE